MFDELKELEGIVVDTRKNYDKVKTDSIKTEQDIEKLKKKK